MAALLAFEDFPRQEDILAIARIESNFNPRARNNVSHGIMQVNHGPWEVAANLQAGVGMLRELFLNLGAVEASVKAYNIGPTAYSQGRLKPEAEVYWKKFKTAKAMYLEQAEQQTKLFPEIQPVAFEPPTPEE